jgi:hypothetical protein
MEIIMPSIKVNKKIYIPMTDTVITRENIDKLTDFKQKVIPDNFDDFSPQLKKNMALTNQRMSILFQKD